MKIIFCLLVLIAGVFWYFHGRSSRFAPSLVRDATAEIAAQTKTAAADVQTAAAKVIHAQPGDPEPSVHRRILTGEKMREQRLTIPQPRQPAGSTPYDRILRGENFPENKRAVAQ